MQRKCILELTSGLINDVYNFSLNKKMDDAGIH